MSHRRLRSCVKMALAALVVLAAPTAFAGNFQFGAMIRAGLAGNANHELGIGGSSTSLTTTGQVNPYFNGNTAQLFEIGYVKSTNTAYVRVHQSLNPRSAFSQVSFNPVGGAAEPANTLWTLPASSFFVRASNYSGNSAIVISNLTLSGLVGPANVIQPLQSTSLVAFQFPPVSQPSVTQSQDLMFRPDSAGNWRLQGNILMVGLQSNGGIASGSDLEFGVVATAGMPEPASMSLALLGVAGMVAFARKRSRRI